LAAWVDNVGKYHGRPTEHIIFECHSFIDGDIILDFYSITNLRMWANDYVLTDPAVFPDPGVAQHMGHMPDRRAFPYFNMGVYECRLVDEILSLWTV
jgi:hypothetical protein